MTIAPMKTAADAQAFYDLNAEWITAHFELEPNDLELLNNPHRVVMDPGGQIYLAHTGGRTVGCVALMAYEPGTYKIAKMAVTPACRGRGIGRQLLVHAIEEARLMGARTLFLASSSTLVPAIRLYETVGFQCLNSNEWPFMRFARANVFMRMDV
ncbi:GNAT family N-acetyltransferase [Deinococcus ruber]|uniref:GNAT family N-acetyltransferase n=1 Tax=Deinococcus ruber TaxID=1848197 RepID=UPI001E31EA32|nr:GNAT family N-acetyltransferase [Deinococcus ruber]